MKSTLANFAQLCGGRLKGADGAYTSVSSDTRTLGRDALFVALRGPNFNGNEFVAAAHAAGAAGALVDSEQPSGSLRSSSPTRRRRSNVRAMAGVSNSPSP